MSISRSVFTALVVLSAVVRVLRADSQVDASQPQPLPPPSPDVWQAKLPDFSEKSYDKAVEALIEGFESSIGQKLLPGPKHHVGLKVYTDSGPGLATPVALTQAVIAALERRGYARRDIFIVGLDADHMRDCGYLPSLVTGTFPFAGNKIYVLDSGRYFNPTWVYDNPLPSRFNPILATKDTGIFGLGGKGKSTLDADRQSFLATPLFLDADFWINLPIYSDHSVLGVNGALVNATLWNASNTDRFFHSPANAPAAVAEMSAIPELRRTWMFTIASLESYQYIGGPWFNSLYTTSEPLVWLSADPVLLDALMEKRMNLRRKENGFPPISDDIQTLQFAATLGVGTADPTKAKFVNTGD